MQAERPKSLPSSSTTPSGKRVFARIARLAVLAVIAITIAALGATGYRRLFIKRTQQEMAAAVKNGLVTVDQEYHNWNITTEASDKPVKIDFYLRNKSLVEIYGTLVFSVDLDSKGLEARFIKQMIEAFGTNFEADDTPRGSKFRAIKAYIKRGQKLAPGAEYEPTDEKDKKHDYAFNFRRFIILKPGEVQHVTHEQDIPPAYRGCLLTVKSSGIEF